MKSELNLTVQLSVKKATLDAKTLFGKIIHIVEMP